MTGHLRAIIAQFHWFLYLVRCSNIACIQISWLVWMIIDFYRTNKIVEKLSWLPLWLNDWAKVLDNGGQVDTFHLDFEKAYDIPRHELLKSKLFSYVIVGTTLKWNTIFFVLQTTASCCKRSEDRLGSSFVVCPTGYRSCSFAVLIVYWHLNRFWNRAFFGCLCLLSLKLGKWGHLETPEWHWPTRSLGKELGYEIPTYQIQYDEADKERDQNDQWRVQFFKMLTQLNTKEWQVRYTHVSNICTKMVNGYLGFLRRNFPKT